MSPSGPHIFERFAEVVRTLAKEECIRFKIGGAYSGITYEDLYQRALGLGEVLRKRGIRSGDRVGIIAENHPSFAAALLAVFAVDAIAVPLDIQYTSEQIRTIVGHSGIKTVLGVSRTFSQWNDGVPDLLTLQMDAGNIVQEIQDLTDPPGFDPGAQHTIEAVILYTSGTTSDPKGVVLTHQNLLANITAILKLDIIQKKDRVLSFLPLHHAYALSATLLTPLLSGAQIVFLLNVSPTDLVKCMQETRITIFVGVPQVFTMMHRVITERYQQLPAVKKYLAGVLGGIAPGLRRMTGINLSRRIFREIHQRYGGHMRLMVSGGAHLEEQIAKDFTVWGFTVVQGYGLTETAPVVTFDSPRKPKVGSVGKPLSNVAIRIVGAKEDGSGEVWIKGPNVMQGYYRNPQATSRVMKDGWFKSGDLARLDKDGHLYLKGRKKEVLVLSSGKNILPDDLEKHLNQLPSVKESAVLAVQMASGAGEQLVGLFVPDEEFFEKQRDMGILERVKWDLENCQARLPSYQHLNGFELIREPLPRTRLGKIRRFQLAKIYEEAHQKRMARIEIPAKVSATGTARLEVRALAFLEQTLQRRVRRSDHLELDLGIDSLGRIEMLMGLQEYLGLKVNEDQAMRFFSCITVEELESTLRELNAGTSTESSAGESIRKWRNLLNENPPEDVRQSVALKMNLGAIFFNLVSITIIKAFFKVFFLLGSTGRPHLPRSGPYIVAANHASYLDGLFIMSALPYRAIVQTYFIGSGKFLEAPMFKPFGKLARLVPIYKDYSLMDTLRACAYLLRNGKALCYFPAGQRSIDGAVQPFKKGIGILVKELDVPVVPVYIDGSFKTWPRGRRFPRLGRVTVRFGEAIAASLFKVTAPGNDENQYQSIADQLQARINALRPVAQSGPKKRDVSTYRSA